MSTPIVPPRDNEDELDETIIRRERTAEGVERASFEPGEHAETEGAGNLHIEDDATPPPQDTRPDDPPSIKRR